MKAILILKLKKKTWMKHVAHCRHKNVREMTEGKFLTELKTVIWHFMPCCAVGSGQHCKEISYLLIHGIKAHLLTQQVPQLRAQLPEDMPPKLAHCFLEKHVPY
jgi:hypothetical protein